MADKNKMMMPISFIFPKFEISKAINFICVLSRFNTVTFNDATVDIDLSVYEKIVCWNNGRKT